MKKRGSLRLIISLVVVAMFALSILAFRTTGQDQSKANKKVIAVPRNQSQINSGPNQFEITLAQLPTVDYLAPDLPDPKERAKREVKSKRYDKYSSEQIHDSENGGGRIWTSHWEQGLPAIPASQSDLILIAQITDARAYLSKDKTGVYSEFNAIVEEVLKNDSANSVQPGASISLEREGGAVRFPSGRVQRFIVSGQGVPQTGRRYVVFLNHTHKVFSNYVEKDDNLFIVTGYELRGDRVIPIDGKHATGVAKWVFDEFDNSDVSTFLTAVRDAIAASVAKGESL